MQLKGAYSGCSWCHGSGCMCCDRERKKAEERAMEPIFTADRNEPEDMNQLKEFFGADALQKAFSPGGRGIQGIQEQAAVARLLQCLRKSRTKSQ